MADSIRVNGNLMSWGSIKFKLDGSLYVGFNSISYADKRERVKGYGMGQHHAPRGRSRGKYSTDLVKVRGHKTSVQALRAAIAAKSVDGISYGDVEFEGVVQYVDTGEEPVTVELGGLVWAENTSNEEESADPLNEEFALDCMAIRRNDLVLFDASAGSPV
jgi:hypothetical protein